MMPDDRPGAGDALRSDGSRDDPRVLLYMGSGRNRQLLVETLAPRYRVEATTDAAALEDEFDCCILDRRRFGRAAEAIRRRDEESDVFLPFLLLVESDSAPSGDPAVWDYVDDVIELPVERAVLSARIENVIERRRTAVRLAERESQLEATVADLRMKERAMDEAPVGITISDPHREDNPLVYANTQFEDLAGYDEADVVGRNCRFLQGEETDPETRATLRDAIDDGRPVSVDLVNYRRNGEKFWNKIDVAPVWDDDGRLTNYVGFQSDITERKIREQRLEVLNRVLSHNLGNKMNLIMGYSELLRDEFGGDPPGSLAQIDEAARDLLRLSGDVRRIEAVLSGSATTGCAIALADRLEEVTSAFRDRFPDVAFDLALPEDDPCEVAVDGIVTAVEEAIDNAAKHNDSPSPSVEIRVEKRGDDWIDIEIEDNGPGIPDREVAVLKHGETSINHADRLGLWLIYWIVGRANGVMTVSDADPSGTVLSLSIPARGGRRATPESDR